MYFLTACDLSKQKDKYEAPYYLYIWVFGYREVDKMTLYTFVHQY